MILIKYSFTVLFFEFIKRQGELGTNFNAYVSINIVGLSDEQNNN